MNSYYRKHSTKPDIPLSVLLEAITVTNSALILLKNITEPLSINDSDLSINKLYTKLNILKENAIYDESTAATINNLNDGNNNNNNALPYSLKLKICPICGLRKARNNFFCNECEHKQNYFTNIFSQPTPAHDHNQPKINSNQFENDLEYTKKNTAINDWAFNMFRERSNLPLADVSLSSPG